MDQGENNRADHINEQTVANIAKLAGIRLSKDDVAHYQQDLEKILTLFDALQKADTSGVDHLCLSPISDMESLREDEACNAAHVKAMETFSPYFDAESGLFEVIQVIEKS